MGVRLLQGSGQRGITQSPDRQQTLPGSASGTILTRATPILLLTRPTKGSLRFWDSLPPDLQAGLRLILSPLMAITLRDLPVMDPVLDPVAGTILSSGHAVPVLAGSLLAGLPCFTVGDATAAQARAAGIAARACGGTADALVDRLIQLRPKAPLVHLRGAHTRGLVAERLGRAGIETREQIVYDQPLCPLSAPACAALSGAAPVLAPLFSPRTARQLGDQLRALPALQAPVFPLCLSPSVADEIRSAPVQSPLVCDDPTARDMAVLVQSVASAVSRLEPPKGAQ